MEFVLIALIIQALVFGFFCAYIAGQKNRSRGNWFALGFFFSILAVLALIAVPKIEPPAVPGDNRNRDDRLPASAASAHTAAARPELQFDGDRSLSASSYQLFLTKRFSIEKNTTLEKFVIGNDVFDDLPTVLREADARYSQHLEMLAEEVRRLERDAAAREQKRRQDSERERAAERERREAEQARRIESDALDKRREEDRQRTLRKAKRWALAAALMVVVVAGFLFRNHAVEQEAQRLAWQATGKFIKDCPDCPEMIAIPAGVFEMGSNESDIEKPQHQVRLKGFLLGRTEVTEGQWRAVMGGNPSQSTDCGSSCPVSNITWDAAQQYASKLSQMTGKTYRLPSEAEWEYAARAGSLSRWSFGDDKSQLEQYAWFDANSYNETHPVAMKRPNVVGLYDMHGGVAEWVQDSWHNNYVGAPVDGSAWDTGDDGQPWRVHRGGAWSNTGPGSVRSASRDLQRTFDTTRGTGLRIARGL